MIKEEEVCRDNDGDADASLNEDDDNGLFIGGEPSTLGNQTSSNNESTRLFLLQFSHEMMRKSDNDSCLSESVSDGVAADSADDDN